MQPLFRAIPQQRHAKSPSSRHCLPDRSDERLAARALREVTVRPVSCPRRTRRFGGARRVGLVATVARGFPKVRTAGSRRPWVSGGSAPAMPSRHAVRDTWSAGRPGGPGHAGHGTGVADRCTMHATRYPYHHRDLMTRRGTPSHITRPDRPRPSRANSRPPHGPSRFCGVLPYAGPMRRGRRRALGMKFMFT